MASARTEGETDPGLSAPASVLASQIRQHLNHMAVPHLQDLSHRLVLLRTEAFRCDHGPLARSLAALHSAACAIQFARLRRGWLSRLLGPDRAAHARFISSYERVQACASQVKTQLAAVAADFGRSQAQPALAALEQDWQALNTGIDEGVTWLQALCTQLARARAQGREDDGLAALAEAAQFFTHDFKQLDSLSSMARDGAVRGRGVLARRTALLQQVGADLAAFEQDWAQRVGDLVTELEGRRLPASAAIQEAIDAQGRLLRRLAASADACSALQQEEHLLADQLGMLERDIARGGRPGP